MMSRRIKVITSLMLLTIITILTPQTWESSLNSYKKKESRKHCCFRDSHLKKKAASYSPTLHCSTIGASGLNFSVRNGKRWNPAAITT